MAPAAGGARRRESLGEKRERHGAVDDPQVVLDAAARFLETRSRSVAEVRRRLTSVGYRTDLVEGAIERLLELGMLDDETFARAWVESRDRARPRGALALRRELALKGVDRETADLVIAERGGDVTADGAGDGDAPSADEAAAERLITRRGSSLARIADPRVRQQRAYALLARNGFDPDVCRTVAGRVGDAQASDGAEDPE